MVSRNFTFGSYNYSSPQGAIVKEESRFNKNKFCFLINLIPIHAGLAEYPTKIDELARINCKNDIIGVTELQALLLLYFVSDNRFEEEKMRINF
jgi:hypothetical protein